MYKRVGILFLFLLITNVYAQSQFGGLTPALTDTLTKSETEIREYLVYHKGTEDLFTGILMDRFPNGQLKFKRSVVDGKSEGIWIGYHENGMVKYIGEWEDGKGHGFSMHFLANGQIRERSRVVWDKWEGISETWYISGLKKSEGHYQQNEKIGTWTYWNEDGSVKEIVTY